MPASPDDGARLAARVAAQVAEAEALLLRRIARALAAGIDRPDWETQKLAELRMLQQAIAHDVTEADARIAATILQVIVEANGDGAALALTDLEAAGLELPRVPDVTPATNIAAEVVAQARAAMQAVPGLLARVYREAVAAGVGEVLGGTVTRLQAAQHVLDRLASNGITGFTDKAGRNWSLTSYVEMAVRTGAGQSAVQGHVDALQTAGIDLVIVSDSPRECPTCRPWEKKILSLSGQVGAVILPSATGGSPVRVDVAGTLDEAKRAGLQHPNCTHSVAAYIPGATSTAAGRSNPDGYEAKERQRAMERKVREWKRRQALALDDQAAARAAAKVREWQAALREHVDAHDLKRLRYREQINLAT